MDKQCSHKKPWDVPCMECELVSKREFVADMAPKVERAKARIEELLSLILQEDLEAARFRAQNKGKPGVLLVGPSGGPYVPEDLEDSNHG